ncbi:MAG: Ig-like domain-containing protein [Bacteroidales bacterium]|nr:Ig-like domain-containing protein [Bacteroidales bacterium]
MKQKKLFTVYFVILAMILVFSDLSCKKDIIEEDKTPVATSIEMFSGDNQNAEAGQILPEIIKILVKDQNGDPFVGASVSFSLSEGSVLITTTLSNIDGIAATTWTLGNTVGNQQLTVIANKSDGTTSLTGSPLVVNATATAVAENIELFSGDDQTGEIETALANPIVVIVKDQSGNAVAGTTVNFAVSEGSVSTETSTTDADGKANVTWTLGSTIGTQTLTVTAFKSDGIIHLTGSPVSINATALTTVTDVEGNKYNAVLIDDQIWMAENLRVTRYANGTAIQLVTDNTAWINLGNNDTDKAYCFYNNNANGEAATYGALYTYAAATNGNYSGNNVQGVCPDGWHLPSDAEWTDLIEYLGGEDVAGGKMKETGTTHWNSPNTGADNTSGFTALPGGYRNSEDGSFYHIGYSCYFWSSVEKYSGTAAVNYNIDYNDAKINELIYYKSEGFSVRCVKD